MKHGPTPSLLENPEIREEFLLALRSMGGILNEACRAIGLERTTVFRYLQKNPDVKALVNEAIEEGQSNLPVILRSSLIDRALNGQVVPTYSIEWRPEPAAKDPKEAHDRAFRGPNVIGYRLIPASDKLLLDTVKAYCPEFRDKPAAINVQVEGGGLDELAQLVLKEAKRVGLHGPSVSLDVIRKRLSRIASTDYNGLDNLTESEAVS